MNAERNASAAWLVPVLVGLLSAGAGLGAGWYLRGSPRPVEPAAHPIEARAANAATREQLEALRQELLAQLQRLGRSGADAASPATAPSDNAVLELGRRIDEIDARVALLSSSSHPAFGGRGWASMRGQGSESIEKMIERIQAQDLLGRKGEKQENIGEVLSREHYLWMLEDVVRQYGPPEHMDTSNGLALYYGRFQFESTDEPCCVCFRVLEGFVTDVGCDCSHRW